MYKLSVNLLPIIGNLNNNARLSGQSQIALHGKRAALISGSLAAGVGGAL